MRFARAAVRPLQGSGCLAPAYAFDDFTAAAANGAGLAIVALAAAAACAAYCLAGTWCARCRFVAGVKWGGPGFRAAGAAAVLCHADGFLLACG